MKTRSFFEIISPILLAIIVILYVWVFPNVSNEPYRVSEYHYADSSYYTVDYKKSFLDQYTAVTPHLNKVSAKIAFDSLSANSPLSINIEDHTNMYIDQSYINDQEKAKANFFAFLINKHPWLWPSLLVLVILFFIWQFLIKNFYPYL